MSEYQPREGVGREVNRSLTEARTVHSRAKTALEKLEAASRWYGRDIDHDQIVADLEEVVSILEKWRRTGR